MSNIVWSADKGWHDGPQANVTLDDRGRLQVSDKAYDAGRERGKNAGSWRIDGNTSKGIARRILQGYNDGDPEVMDIQPSPLSGEWAGESIPEMSAEYGIDLAADENADRFETGFADGWWDEVISACKTIISE